MPGRFAKKDLIVTDEAERESIDERIQCVSIVKRDFTADSRHAKRISVMRNTCHDTCQQRSIAPAVLRMVERSKPQTVHRRDRPRAHREDVAQNSADAGRCALKRFDKRRMIVRLDLESSAPAVAEIDDAGILARRHDHARAGRRQSFQVNARRFVRAVLGPHDREDAEFGKTRFAAKQFFYSLEFFGSEIVGGDNFGSDHREAKGQMRRPVLLPITFLDHFVDRFAQLGRIDASDVLVNNLAFFVVKKVAGRSPRHADPRD